jgi:hypothetical protein
VLLALVNAIEQWLHGNPLLAAGILVAALAAAVQLWRWFWPGRAQALRQLRLGSDGSAFLLTADGHSRSVALMPGSMRLGPFLLLALREAQGGCHWLLLGPSNTDPAGLAALRRRLRRPPTVPGLLR